MPTAYLDIDLMPFVDRVTAILDEYDPVTQMKIIELVMTRQSLKAGKRGAVSVLDAMHKHIRHVLRQVQKGAPPPGSP